MHAFGHNSGYKNYNIHSIRRTFLIRAPLTGGPRIVKKNRSNRKSYYVKFVLFEIEYRYDRQNFD